MQILNLSTTNVDAKQGSTLYNCLAGETVDDLDLIRKSMKAEAIKARRRIKDKLLAFSEVGPFGSCDHQHPLETASVLQEIHRPGSNLVDIWRKNLFTTGLKSLKNHRQRLRSHRNVRRILRRRYY